MILLAYFTFKFFRLLNHSNDLLFSLIVEFVRILHCFTLMLLLLFLLLFLKVILSLFTSHFWAIFIEVDLFNRAFFFNHFKLIEWLRIVHFVFFLINFHRWLKTRLRLIFVLFLRCGVFKLWWHLPVLLLFLLFLSFNYSLRLLFIFTFTELLVPAHTLTSSFCTTTLRTHIYNKL